MKIADLHPQENLRLETLKKLDVLDSEDEQVFDEITQLASELCGTDISLVSLVDLDRQWFKSKWGIDAKETSRDVAFCAHAILQEEVFEVENASEDERFSDNPLVTQDPNIRFYAGAPLITSSGMPIGTLCVIDSKPKKLSDQQLHTLRILAKQVIGQLELRIKNKYLNKLNQRSSAALSILAKEVRSPATGISGLSKFLSHHADTLGREQVSEISESILQASVHVYSIIDDLLLWCQQASKPNKTKLASTQPRVIIDKCIELFSHDVQSKHLSVENKIPLTLNIMADNNLLRSVIRNLLAVAIKCASSEEKIVISGEIDKSDSSVVNINIEGMVLPEQVRASLLKKLSSTEQDETDDETELGLYVCIDFLRDQEGQLTIDPNKDGSNLIRIGFLASANESG